MRNNPLDDIIKCQVEISSPGISDATFDTILIIVSAPEAEGTAKMDGVTAIGGADELLDYGFSTDHPAYVAATVAFSQSPTPDKLLVCIRKKTNTEGEETKYESITDTLVRAGQEANFYGIHLTEFKDPEDVQDAIKWTEANEKMFGFEYTDYNALPVKNFSYYRSFGMYSGDAEGYTEEEQPEENKYAALAWMAKCFGYDPGTETWHLKELATIVQSRLSTDKKNKLPETHINTFLRYAGCNCTIGGYTLAGEWIDVIRFRDWLKNEMQIRVFNVLKVNRKVPFTDNGIAMIEGAMEATLKAGQKIGGIAPTEYDTDGNPIPGYTITIPKASELTEAQRKSRKLPYCNYTARLAGAIHAVEIEGFLTF